MTLFKNDQRLTADSLFQTRGTTKTSCTLVVPRVSLFNCLLLLANCLLISGCWYRQCPIKGCQVKHEHSHGDRIVRGRGTLPKPHFFGAPRTMTQKRERANEKRRNRG
ncbi:MAG: hypothetical protein MUE30_09950 [Spirosomaceae bacterium]|nr:hypothetical protein [Spirosomataceae bacterium]